MVLNLVFLLFLEIIYIHTESDTDHSSISDGDELFSEDFGSDLIEDTSSMEGLTIDSELEDSDDSFEEESIPGNFPTFFSWVKFCGLILISSKSLKYLYNLCIN